MRGLETGGLKNGHLREVKSVMKHSVLRNITHNLADSLASGCSLLVGAYELDIFGEARKAESGRLIVDFLQGTVSGGEITGGLSDAVNAVKIILPEFCTSHGANLEDFMEMKAHFFSTLTKNRFTVVISDKSGRLNNRIPRHAWKADQGNGCFG